MTKESSYRSQNGSKMWTKLYGSDEKLKSLSAYYIDDGSKLASEADYNSTGVVIRIITFRKDGTREKEVHYDDNKGFATSEVMYDTSGKPIANKSTEPSLRPVPNKDGYFTYDCGGDSNRTIVIREMLGKKIAIGSIYFTEDNAVTDVIEAKKTCELLTYKEKTAMKAMSVSCIE